MPVLGLRLGGVPVPFLLALRCPRSSQAGAGAPPGWPCPNRGSMGTPGWLCPGYGPLPAHPGIPSAALCRLGSPPCWLWGGLWGPRVALSQLGWVQSPPRWPKETCGFPRWLHPSWNPHPAAPGMPGGCPGCPCGTRGVPGAAVAQLGWVRPSPPLPAGQAPAVSGNQPCLHQFQLLFVSQPAWPPAGRSPRSRPAGAACAPALAQ